MYTLYTHTHDTNIHAKMLILRVEDDHAFVVP